MVSSQTFMDNIANNICECIHDDDDNESEFFVNFVLWPNFDS